MRFREAVYVVRDPTTMIDTRTDKPVTFTPTNGCRVLLLRLSDDMNAKGIVSVSRSTLAQHLGVAPARITEWVNVATRFGFLSSVRRGQPGVTAVYQGCLPSPGLVLPGVPSTRYARADHAGVREGVPTDPGAWYALGGSHEGTGPAATGTGSFSPTMRRGNDEKTGDQPVSYDVAACQWHEHVHCPDDCANHPSNLEATA